MSNLAAIAIAYVAALASVPDGDEPRPATPPAPHIETVPVPVKVIPPPRMSPPPPPPPAPRPLRGPDSPPRPRLSPNAWVTPEDYPLDAMLMEERGRSLFAVQVNPDGRVANCTIVESSGFARLDDLTCRLVTRRARFSPAMTADGAPTVGFYSQAVRWELDNDGSLKAKTLGWSRPKSSIANKERGLVAITAVVQPDGTVSDCRVLTSSGHPTLDTETCRRIEQYRWQTPARDADGKPVPRVFATAISW